MSTPTINGHTHDVTVRGDVHVRVRASGNPVEASDPVGSLLKAACTRAIPQVDLEAQRSKVRDFASRHGGATKDAAASSWLLTERPRSLSETVRTVPPVKGEASNAVVWVGMTAAGLFRLAVTTASWLTAFAVATRLRAGVALILTVLLFTAHIVARHL